MRLQHRFLVEKLPSVDPVSAAITRPQKKLPPIKPRIPKIPRDVNRSPTEDLKAGREAALMAVHYYGPSKRSPRNRLQHHLQRWHI